MLKTPYRQLGSPLTRILLDPQLMGKPTALDWQTAQAIMLVLTDQTAVSIN